MLRALGTMKLCNLGLLATRFIQADAARLLRVHAHADQERTCLAGDEDAASRGIFRHIRGKLHRVAVQAAVLQLQRAGTDVNGATIPLDAQHANDVGLERHPSEPKLSRIIDGQRASARRGPFRAVSDERHAAVIRDESPPFRHAHRTSATRDASGG